MRIEELVVSTWITNLINATWHRADKTSWIKGTTCSEAQWLSRPAMFLHLILTRDGYNMSVPTNNLHIIHSSSIVADECIRVAYRNAFDMMKHNQQIGKWGEDAVAAYLVERGYEIIARNARTPYGEIDIVAKQNDITVFVEVKSRTSLKMGLPEESVNLRKQAHMLACAEHYAAEHAIDHWQIDVIAVEGKQGLEPKITHFENAI